jgi:hypothetical protein
MSNKPIASKTFTTELVLEGSWGVSDQGKHESTMDLHEVEGEAGRGFIDWDIPALERTEEIGLWYEMVDGKRTLRDYDGVFSLPEQAIELLRTCGIVVPEEFED